jgi:mannosyltransferase OCH1-like enzyme
MKQTISQIFITDEPTGRLPPFLDNATRTVADAFPDYEHTVYNNKTLRDFIAAHYDDKVVWAYDKLRPYSFKANLGRYCLLNAIGGWYFDIGVRAARGIGLGPKVEFLAFRDIQRFSGTSWACATSVLYSQPDNPALRTAIAYIVRNCKDEYYGMTPLCVSGPGLLGEALAANRANPNHLFGDYLALTPNHKQKNRAFVLPDGTILAWSKPASGGDLTELGAKGVNNYNELWKAREVYAPD